MEQLKIIKEQLVGQVMGQMGNLQHTNTEELGQVIDMIKDLAEATYYCTIVEAMEDKDKQQPQNNNYYYTETRYPDPRYCWPDYDDRDMDMPYRMYYSGSSSNSGGGRSGGNGGNSSSSSSGGGNNSGSSYYTEHEFPMRDSREGRSGSNRRMYMEAKEMKRDKASQLKELENYMSELSSDITEMISDASPEEKQMLQKKLTMLAQKIQG